MQEAKETQETLKPRLDLSTVDRESLPLGVTRLYGKRMKLDVRRDAVRGGSFKGPLLYAVF